MAACVTPIPGCDFRHGVAREETIWQRLPVCERFQSFKVPTPQIPDVSTETGLRDKTVLELMYAAGLRVSEVVDLQLNNIDLDAGILTCKGKGDKTRRVPIGKSAVEWLRTY
jgi:site-specific recombinase XerD